MPELSAVDLVVGWNKKPVAVLDQLRVPCGSIVVLAGPNGVGKSTAIKTLARQIPPLSGRIELDGQDIFGLHAKQFAQCVSYVPQLIEPPRHITVADLVALGRNPHQAWWQWELQPDDRDVIGQALERTGTSELREKNLHDLSGGERQRAVIAMALAQQAQFLLLDEPTAHLDFKHQLQLLALLQELRSQGLGILLILHDLNLIARIADQVVLLKKEQQEGRGRLAAAGAPQSVLVPTTLKDVYEVDVTVNRDPATGLTSYVPTLVASTADAAAPSLSDRA